MPEHISTTTNIDAKMTVQQVMMAYPACRAVFERHGLAGCGGPYGPPEPLDFFASAHHVDLEALLRELREAGTADLATSPPHPASLASLPASLPASPQGAAAAEPIFRPFLWSSLAITLSVGSLWGVYNLTRIAYAESFGGVSLAWSQAHGHAQMFGWVALFIMGLGFYVLPRFRNAPGVSARWAKTSLVMMAAGVIMRATAQPWAIERFAGGVLVASGFLELAAIALFAGGAASILARGKAPWEGYEKFLIAGIAWFVALGLWNFWTVWVMARGGYSIMFGPLNDGLIVLALLGFAANVIFGISLRILPNFLGLRTTRARLRDAGFLCVNAGVLLSILPAGRSLPAALLLLAGAACVAAAVRIFEPPRVRVAIRGVDQAFSWFVVQGYGWLLVGLVIALAPALWQRFTAQTLPLEITGAARHAIALGFVTSLMLGLGHRVLPVFHGVALASPKLLRLSFWLLLTGTVLRVGGQLAVPYGGKVLAAPLWAALGFSGYLQLAAIVCFAINLWRTLHRPNAPAVQEPTEQRIPLPVSSITAETPVQAAASPAREISGTMTVDANTLIAPLAERYPALKEALIDLGFEHLRHLPRIPALVTVGMAARQHGLDLDALIARIVEVIAANNGVRT